MNSILFIGDIHIKMSNLHKVNLIIDKVRDKTLWSTSPSTPTLAVIAGDILDTHERLHTQLMNKALGLIMALANHMPTFVLVGNHDYINNSQFCSDEHWMVTLKSLESNHNFTIVDRPLTHHDLSSDQRFTFAPYVPEGRFVEALNKYLDKAWLTSTCVFAHQTFKGAKMGAIVSEDGDAWESTWPQVISGHIHERQHPWENVFYPGSIINHTFGYDSQGCFVFTFTKDVQGYLMDEIDLGFKKKKSIHLKAQDIGPISVYEIDTENLKYVITGSYVEIKTLKPRIRTLFGNSKVKFRIQCDEGAPSVDKKKALTNLSTFQTILERKLTDDLRSDYKLLSA